MAFQSITVHIYTRAEAERPWHTVTIAYAYSSTPPLKFQGMTLLISTRDDTESHVTNISLSNSSAPFRLWSGNKCCSFMLKRLFQFPYGTKTYTIRFFCTLTLTEQTLNKYLMMNVFMVLTLTLSTLVFEESANCKRIQVCREVCSKTGLCKAFPIGIFKFACHQNSPINHLIEDTDATVVVSVYYIFNLHCHINEHVAYVFSMNSDLNVSL